MIGELRFEPKVPLDKDGVPVENAWLMQWFKFRHWMFRLVITDRFNLTIAVLIMINTVILASDHYKMS